MKKISIFGLVSLLSLLLIIILFLVPIWDYTNKFDLVSSVFFHDSVKTDELVQKYDSNKKIKIMIVPGHDEENFGAIWKNIKEADMNVEVANKLEDFLKKNKKFEVFVVRDKDGYNRTFERYLEKNTEEIIEFKDEKIAEMEKLVEEGKIQKFENIHHNFAKPEVSKILYGVNHFANENKFDMVIHIHFNDYPGRKFNQIGKYSGFSIYVPEKQYSNAEVSYDLAEKISENLLKNFSESNLPIENAINEDQDLIAIGSNNTADPISILIEYGYIYERQFHDSEIKEIIFEELAQSTYNGILSYFNEEFFSSDFISLSGQEIVDNLGKEDSGMQVLITQTLLKNLGFYPPEKNLSDCPLNGYFGDCTEEAVKAFQKANGITQTGYVGEKTRELLNNAVVYSL